MARPSEVSRRKSSNNGDNLSQAPNVTDLWKPRHVRFFCNGDQFFKGKKVLIVPHRYLTFDHLLNDLTGNLRSCVRLPYGVRTVYSPVGGSKIESVDSLKDGKNYVAAGFETFRPIEYGKSELCTWSSVTMSWHGQRVTDPKPVVRLPLDEYGVKPSKGLESVFKGVDHAKSQLRNIEHRLQDAERPGSSMPMDDSLNVPVDRVPTYILHPSAKSSSVLVDSLGKTHHLRSREEISSRKVSRMDDKYKDRDYKERWQRSPLIEPNALNADTRQVAWTEDDLGMGTATTATTSGYKTGTGSLTTTGYKSSAGASVTTNTTGYKSATGSTLRGLSSMETRGMRSTGKSGHGVHFSRDDSLAVLTQDGGVRGYMDLPGRWSKTDAAGVSSAASGWGHRSVEPLASTYPPKASAGADASRVPTDLQHAMTASGSSTASAPPNVNSTYTLNGQSSSSVSPNSNHFKSKKSLRDLESSSDTLAKLREKVRQQKLASSGESQGSSENDLHVNHNLNDPVVTRPAGHQAEPPVIVRKVAAGPPVPRYQGFSEVDTKYILPDGKMVKFSEFRKRKQRKLRKEGPLKDKHPAPAIDADDKKPTKALRVIAPQKKPAKADKQTGDIITTRSWRVGSKIVLQELGPNKLPMAGESPPVKDKPDAEKYSNTSGAVLSSEARSVLRDIQDMSGSEDDQDKEENKKDDSKRPHQRKRKPVPNMNDVKDDEKQAKVRHYDPDEVKRYMARQRSERKRREQEESSRTQELRKQRESQLAELYRRQREGCARVPAPHTSIGAGGLPRSDSHRQEHSLKPSGESDKENGGSAWGEMSSSDSTLSGSSGPPHTTDVLKQAAADADYYIKKYATHSSELSDLISKYSIPGASARRSRDLELGDDSTSAHAAPSASKPDPPYLNTYTMASSAIPADTPTGLRDGGVGLGVSAVRYLAEVGIKADDVINRFSSHAANIGTSYAPPPSRPAALTGASTLPTYLREPVPMNLPNQPFSASTTVAGPLAVMRQQRIRALAENASLLGHRLNSQTKQMASLTQAQSTADRWAAPREEDSADGYRTRYDRMTGTIPYSVYDQDIPGVGSLARHTSRSHEDVTKAGHRDYTYKHLEPEDRLSELSDSTLHEDKLYQPLPINKPALGKIRLPGTTIQPAGRDSLRARSAVTGRWDEPAADPYSVLNVLSRRKDPLSRDHYKRVGLFDDTEPDDADHTLGSISDHQLSDNLSLSDDSTFTGEAPTDKDKSTKQQSHHSMSEHSASHHSISHHSISHNSISHQTASQRSRSPVSVSQLSEDDSSLGAYTKSYTESRSRPAVSQRSAHSLAGAVSHRSRHSASSRHSPTHSLRATSVKPEKKTTLEDQGAVGPPAAEAEPAVSGASASAQEDDQDDTLEGPPSPEPMSDIPDLPDEDAALSIEISDMSASSDLSVPNRSVGNRRAYAPGGIAYRPSLVSGRLSPGGLERRMTAELNLLDSMEESVRQLTKVDRTRGISLAQQESVSLAQILKAQEQGHAQQLAAYQRDSAFLTRELTGAQRTAALATETASASIEKARQETTRSMQESTANFIAVQSEAAKATAEAARQLAEVKVAATGAAGSITELNTSRLVKETAVAMATAMSSVLKDTQSKRTGEDHATQYSARSAVRSGGESYTSDTFDSEYSQSLPNTRSLNKPSPATRSESRLSYTRGVETATPGTSPNNTESVKTASVVTASDLSQNNNASVATESGVEAVAGSHDNSKSESILEEVMSEKVHDDYSIDFDTSVTEEEMEKSLREVLPSKDHRRNVKRTSSQSDLSSVASDDHKEALNSLSTPSSRRLSFEGDSFTKFTVDMVRQYMREEEIRAQHQGALLKLRERALKEKTQAELAWLEQQKTRGRDKGADEVYPLFKKKRRGLLLKLQQEQAEIRRLKEASRAASKERQFLLMQSQEIARLRQTTQQIAAQTRHGGSTRVEQWLCELDSSSLDVDSYSSLAQVKEKIKSGPATAPETLDIPTEDELNFNLDDSEILSLASPSKDESVDGDKKEDLKPLQKLRKMKLDDKFLTHREQQLLQRRAQVEGLLEWKQKLDREEAEIEAMEKAARKLTKNKKDAARKEKDGKDKKEKEKSPTTQRTQRADTIASELDSIKEESYSESFTISRSTSVAWPRHTPRTDTDIPEDVPESARTRASNNSIGEDLVIGALTNGQTTASIAEEIPTSRSGKSQTEGIVQKELNTRYKQVLSKLSHPEEGSTRTPDSSDEANVTSSTHEEYTNETFESDAGTTTTTAPGGVGAKKGPATPPRLQLGASDSGRLVPRSPKSPLKSPLHRTGSESESEDSLSVALSETASDQSDLETRIRALSEDLKRRKLEAERLKKEAKKQQKERLRQEEVALQKQIEAYDKYIAEARLEITDDVELQERTPTGAVQPQIKRPTPVQKRPPVAPRSPKDTTPRSPKETAHHVRTDSDGSRSTSSIETGGDSPGQATPLSPITPGGCEELDNGKPILFADGISEALMSPLISGKKTSTPVDKSSVESRSRMVEVEQTETIDEVPEEVSAMGQSPLEEVSEVKLRFDLSRMEDMTDRAEPQKAKTTHSVRSVTEDIPVETAATPASVLPRAHSGEETSFAHSKSEAAKTITSEKSVKSHYSSDFVDDSDRSKSDKSFTYSTSKNSRSESSYTDEFTEVNTTGKSFPRRQKDHDRDHSVSQLKKPAEVSQENSIAVDSIQTEEEVSEQLDAETDDDDEVVMLDMDAAPIASPAQPSPDPLAHLRIGDRVLVGGARPGVLRFKGNVKFTDGYFGGVELDKSEGTNNGTKNGVEYFHCSPNHGLFAPPEKLEPMPANWKDDEPDKSASDSDISEATIQETDEDAAKITELRKDVTKPEHENKAASSVREADDSLSLADDTSVTTTVDSELERVISSAAAAVESFGAEQLEAEQSCTVSPVNTTVSDTLSPRSPPVLEKMVDRITDGILHMVVKDSVESVGEVTQKMVAKRQSSKTDSSSVPLQKLVTVPKDKAAKPTTTAEDDLASQTKAKPDSIDSDNVVELATQKLLSESISQMLSIYKKKQKIDEDEEEGQIPETQDLDGEPRVKTWPADSSAEPTLTQINARPPDILTLDDNGFDPFPGLSDDFHAGKDDLDRLYDEIGELTGDTDEWFDDDFGLGLEKRAPPPYPGTPQDKKDKSDNGDLCLDLRGVTQEPFFVVPHRTDEVRGLVERAVNVFWELRRYGESWADVTCPPEDYLKPDEREHSQDMESGNRRAYKQLVFQLTGEVLTDIYQDEEVEEEPCSWMLPRRTRQRYYRGRTPPTVRDLVQPVVEDQVLRLSGLQPGKSDVRLTKWSSRKKRDRVDNVLLQELVEEEPDWVDYNEDETTVKMQIADSIFDSLLVETAAVFTKIAQRRSV